MEKSGYQRFEDLEVWKKSRALKNEIFKETTSFPRDEKYRLCEQIIKSSQSVTAQLAEGHGRRTIPDRIRFCIYARGSLAETLNHLIDALDAGYISTDQLSSYRQKIEEIEKILNGYIRWLESKSAA